jgi:hypothetical protein
VTDPTQQVRARLAEMRERCEKAPSKTGLDLDAMFDPTSNSGYVFRQYITGVFTPDWQNYTAFHAASRTDLPACIEVIEALMKYVVDDDLMACSCAACREVSTALARFGGVKE